MLRIIKKNGKPFIVANHKGLEELRHGKAGSIMEFEHLCCGHYVYPAQATYSHETVHCPICGTTHKGKGFSGQQAHLNGQNLRTFCIGIDVIGEKH